MTEENKVNEENKEVVEEKEIAKTGDTAKPNADLTVRSAQDIPGAEEITSEDIAIPRIRLLQALSEEVQQHTDGATPGKLIHSITGQVFDEIEFIPIKLFKTRIMFDTGNRSGAPLCTSRDNMVGSDSTMCKDCENAQWSSNGPPICNQVYNYLIMFPSQVNKELLPCIISFLRTSIKKSAMKLNAQVLSSGKPFWNMVWKLVPSEKTYTKGVAYILNVQQVRASTEEERKYAEQIYNVFGKKKIDPVEHNHDEVDI